MKTINFESRDLRSIIWMREFASDAKLKIVDEEAIIMYQLNQESACRFVQYVTAELGRVNAAFRGQLVEELRRLCRAISPLWSSDQESASSPAPTERMVFGRIPNQGLGPVHHEEDSRADQSQPSTVLQSAK